MSQRPNTSSSSRSAWVRARRVALCLALGMAAAGCKNGAEPSNQDLDARLEALEQSLAELSARVEALETAQGPAPTGPVDARDVRWRDPAGTRTDLASALSNLATQLDELAAQVATVKTDVATVESTVANLDDSVATLQSYHECPPGATRIGSKPDRPGFCVDQYVSSKRIPHHFAAKQCAQKGGRLCTHAELIALAILVTVYPDDLPSEGQIAPPPDIPDDDPDLGRVEWLFDSAHVKIPGKDLYDITGLYYSWPIRGTGNPILDGTPGLELPYRCCYDR